jgi:hypothetical protein
VLLIMELLIGAVPLSALYIYFLPAGIFWMRQVVGLAAGGTVNAFTSGVMVLYVTGAIGLVSLWLAMIHRLAGRGAPGRIVRSGLLLGMVVAIAVLVLLSILGALWQDYCLYGAPLVVAAHQLCSRTTSRATSACDALPSRP